MPMPPPKPSTEGPTRPAGLPRDRSARPGSRASEPPATPLAGLWDKGAVEGDGRSDGLIALAVSDGPLVARQRRRGRRVAAGLGQPPTERSSTSRAGPAGRGRSRRDRRASGSSIPMWPALTSPSASRRRPRVAPSASSVSHLASGRPSARLPGGDGGADVEVDSVLGGLALRHLLEPQPRALAVGVDRGRGVVAVLLGDVPGVERLVPRLVRWRRTVEPVAQTSFQNRESAAGSGSRT